MKKAPSKGKLRELAVETHTLSKVLEQHAEQQLGRLSLVQKAISVVDVVPQRYHNIHTLYLSGNFIAQLENLCQFKQLKVLSLATNSVSSIHQLNYLPQLPRLENLNLSGNPVAKHLLYRTTLCGNCKQLKILDNTNISHQEKVRFGTLFKTLENRFLQLMDNFWTMEKMCRFGKNIDLHRHINRKEECCRLDSLDRYLKMCDLSDQYSGQAKEKLWDNLYQDCLLIYNNAAHDQHSPEDRFIQATVDLLERQHQKIQQLDGKLTAKIQLQHKHQVMSDTDLFSELESKVLSQEKAQRCRSLFLMVNAFLALKHYTKTPRKREQRSPRKARMNVNLEMGSQIINLVLLRTKKAAIEKIKQQTECILSSEYKIRSVLRLRIKNKFHRLRALLVAKYNREEVFKHETIKHRRVRKELLKKYITLWREEYQKKLIEKNTKEVCRMFEEAKLKEKKYAQKTELLEEYVEVLKSQHHRELTQLQQSKATRRSPSPHDRNFVTFDTVDSPEREYRIQPRHTRQRSSPHTERLKTSHMDNDFMNSSNQYCLGSQMKENHYGTANLMMKTRQRVLNRKQSDTSTDRLQVRRQEIVTRLKQMSML